MTAGMSDTTAEPAPKGQEEGIPQPYHLVKPSPWPLIGAAAGGLFTLGLVFYMHYGTVWLVTIGFLSILATMVGWWRDVIHESVKEKAHSAVTKIGMRYGMILFIASEVMFFVAFFWGYFDPALSPDDARQVARLDYTQGHWPPEGLVTIAPFGLPFLMTLVLLLSGTTVTWAHHALREGKTQEAAQALGITVGLGIAFTAIQAYEYLHAPFGFTQGVYSSAFYMATGFHGFHVIVGTIFLAVCWWRVTQGHFTKDSHFGFEAAAWYWHFVDVVWLFLFSCIYWWGSGSVTH
jgi:cytochrome c oxidase subunit 3